MIDNKPGYKYDLDTEVTAKRELTILGIEDETGEEYEIVIPAGTRGVIVSCGRSSAYGWQATYDVQFEPQEPLGDDGEYGAEVTFLQDDLEAECAIEEAHP